MSELQDLTLKDFLSDEFFNNPYPVYEKLRNLSEAFWLPHDRDTSLTGLWLFSRYADSIAIFKQTQSVSKNLIRYTPSDYRSPFFYSMLFNDGSDHLRLRKLVSDYFSVQSVEVLRPMIVIESEALVASIQQQSEFEFIQAFAEQLPLRVMAKLIGVPEDDMTQVRIWSTILCAGFDSLLSNQAVLSQQRETLRQFNTYVEGLIAVKRIKPDNSMLSALIQAEGQQLNHTELVGMVAFLLFAGHETTISLIGSMMWLLLSHPQQLKLLLRHHQLVPKVVEETLRFESPEQRTTFRVTQSPLTINGQHLEIGTQIGVVIGSANRDSEMFENAEQFDITRHPNQHLAFGIGLHNCLGKTLARVEAQVALESLLGQLDTIKLKDEAPTWRKNSFFRGITLLRLARI